MGLVRVESSPWINYKKEMDEHVDHHFKVMFSPITASFVLIAGFGMVAASGFFDHGHHGWEPHHHADHEHHGHGADWEHDNHHAHGWDGDHHHDHEGKHGFNKGDQSDWARADYGGHKAKASGDEWHSNYGHEAGDDHGHDGGFSHGDEHGHGGHGHWGHHDGHHGHGWL